MDCQWKDKIFNITPFEFDATALELFRYQYEKNAVYRDYVNALKIKPEFVQSITQIPFLPISFFKSHRVVTGNFEPELIFESSGTTGMINSRHFIKDSSIYIESFRKGFELSYGHPEQWCIIGLLPSYLERKNSSLVYMVENLVKSSKHPDSGFYLNEFDKLNTVLQRLEEAKQPTLLIGVTFALLDFAEKYPLQLQHTIIMETGGMKGRKKEMIREEVHDILKNTFNVSTIHAEYGMTELLSQAYSDGNGLFKCSPWMKVLIRDDEDPLLVQSNSDLTGAINIIDLANIHSCSFIATDDAGKISPDGKFKILGRMDNSDLRGCSLMVL
jgi:phenylacetate-coenzyme A ligase PaaK-like adenylate-forming protein